MARTKKEVTVGASRLKPKKKRIFGKILLTLIIGILLGGGGVYYYLEIYVGDNSDKSLLPKQDKEKNTDDDNLNIKDLSVDSYLVKSLMNRIHFQDGTNEEKILYVNEKTKAKELSENYLDKLLLKEAFQMQSSFTDTVSVSDLEVARTNLFGNNYEIVIPTDKELGTCPTFTYNIGDRTYTRDNVVCNVNNDIEIVYKTVSASMQEEKQVSIYEVVAFVEKDKVYKKIDGSNNLSEEVDNIDVDNFNIKDNVQYFNRFKYNFSYDKEHDNYVFESVELVK